MIRTTAKGKSVDTHLTNDEALKVVTKMISEGRGSEFAKDIARKAGTCGISNDQWTWIHILAVQDLTPAPASTQLDISGIVELFRTAGEHLKHPKVRLLVGDQQLMLSVAGQKAKFPNSINVTDGGKFGANQWFGRIGLDGLFSPAKSVDGVSLGKVEEALREFSADPAGVSARYGKLVGVCCFCGMALEDERSTEVGRGPVCSKNYGLPWGKKDNS